MIQVQVKLFATLRHHQPRAKLGEGQNVSLPEKTSLRQLVVKLGIPASTVKTMFVNGKIVREDHVLCDGDEVGIFPPVAGG